MDSRENHHITLPKRKSRGRKGRGRGGRGAERRAPTAIENDPLWLDAFVIEGDRGFIEEVDETKIAPNYKSFISLCERTYDQIAARDRQWGQLVSPSMYTYYNTMHLWSRLASIRVSTGRAILEEENLIQYINNHYYTIHDSIKSYFRGLENFGHWSSSKRRNIVLQIPTAEVHNGIPGYFGRVAANTQCYYEEYPAPGVLAQRIHADYMYTIGQGPRIWDLPVTLRPQPPGARQAIEQEQAAPIIAPYEHVGEDAFKRVVQRISRQQVQATAVPEPVEHVEIDGEDQDEAELKPTVNVLGWYPSKMLTTSQRQLIEHCGITDEEFPVDFPSFALNIDLIEAIALRMRPVEKY